MDKERGINFIESSFLNEMLLDHDVTDISYNGEELFYVSNSKGRMKSKVRIEQKKVSDFIRQIANLAEKQFSYTVPELDFSIGKYRINAIHHSIGKVKDEGAITFSIRIASEKIRINDKSDFFTPQIVELIDYILSNNMSIVIGGITGTGKTEFQKFMLTRLKENTRVIVIDNVMELDQVRSPKIDLTCWQIDEKNPNATPGKLIKSALRNNPDWLILAEARDKEMIDVLNSAMTGMPIITTLHSLDVNSLPHRMARMMMKGEQRIDFNEALNDIYYHFHFYFYLEKEFVNGQVNRFISSICYIDSNGRCSLLYERKNNKHYYYKLPEKLINKINLNSVSNSFKKDFIGA